MSTISGIMPMARSTLLEVSASCSMRTELPRTTRNAMGEMDTPAPPPPPNSCLEVLLGKSDPPVAKPNDTFDTGSISVPSGMLMGLPMMVLESTMLFIFSRVTSIRPSMGCSFMMQDLPASNGAHGLQLYKGPHACCHYYKRCCLDFTIEISAIFVLAGKIR